MTHRRRAVALGSLAVALGTLAAADVAGREAALRRRLAPLVPVLVARGEIERGERIASGDLAVRRVPARFAPQVAFRAAAEVEGARAAVGIPAGVDLQPALLSGAQSGVDGALAAAARGERIARVVAVAAADELPPGARADLLVTGEGPDGVRARLALEDVEVVASGPAAARPDGESAGLPRAVLALRVTLRQALELAGVQASGRELRALARPPSGAG